MASVVAARLEHGDIGENEAARQLAKRLAGANLRCAAPFTGRVNLFAETAGLVIIDADGDRPAQCRRRGDHGRDLAALTAPSRTATWWRPSRSFHSPLPAQTLDGGAGGGGSTAPRSRFAPFRPMRVGVVSTLLPGLKASVVAKTLRVLEARLAPAGARIVAQETSPHEVGPLAQRSAADRAAAT